jgi:hypothetical protein
MTWFSLGSGNRRAKPERVQRFEQADRVVVKVFADLHEARHLKDNSLSRISPGTVQRFERKAWDRLIDYLIKLPPLPSESRRGSEEVTLFPAHSLTVA